MEKNLKVSFDELQIGKQYFLLGEDKCPATFVGSEGGSYYFDVEGFHPFLVSDRKGFEGKVGFDCTPFTYDLIQFGVVPD